MYLEHSELTHILLASGTPKKEQKLQILHTSLISNSYQTKCIFPSQGSAWSRLDIFTGKVNGRDIRGQPQKSESNTHKPWRSTLLAKDWLLIDLGLLPLVTTALTLIFFLRV